MTFDTDAINNIKFTQGFRGYDTAEVDEFLDDMIREIEKLNNNIKNLKDEVSKEKRKNQLNLQEIDRLTELNEKLSTTQNESHLAVEEPKPVVEKVEEAPKPVEEPVIAQKATSIEDIKGTPEYEEMKQILTDTLLSAQQHAEKLVKDAQDRSVKLIEEGERKANDRIVALNVEIQENQDKLGTITAMVMDAKQRFKRNFQDQITALESIIVGDEETKEELANDFEPEEVIKEEVKSVEVKEEMPAHEMPSLDDLIAEKVEEVKQEEMKQEAAQEQSAHAKPAEPAVQPAAQDTPAQGDGVSTFDFASLKKSLAESQDIVPEPPKKEFEDKQPEIPDFDTKSNEEDENQQYIELALSTYNDNKHHNTDYPNQVNKIKINEDDDEGGIYQPENRSVLSSVIEEILNNKKNED